MAEYPIYEIIELDYPSEKQEPLGTKEKIWVLGPRNKIWLCKSVRVRETTGLAAGEDWAEVIASRLCSLLVIPHAHYEFALWKNKRAAISRNFLWQGRDEFHTIDEIFQLPEEPSVAKRRERSRVHHTLPALWELFGASRLRLPAWRGVPKGITTPQELFLGYLMLDALIGNTDRHEQNLGVIYRYNTASTKYFLAPAYDHGSSLGRELLESRCLELLSDDVAFENYRTNCIGKIYTGGESSEEMRTMASFCMAAGWSKKAARIWLESLRNLTDEPVRDIISKVPNHLMSDSARQLGVKLITKNREELLKMGKILI
jgi:hypothetical protein